MQLQDVAFADHEVARNHNPVDFSFAPDSGVLEVLDEIAMDLLGNIQNCTSASHNIRVSKIRFLSRSLRVNTNDVQKIVHESFELFYLNRRRGCGGKGVIGNVFPCTSRTIAARSAAPGASFLFPTI